MSQPARPVSPRTRKTQLLESKFLLLKQMTALDKLEAVFKRVDVKKRARRFNHWKIRNAEQRVRGSAPTAAPPCPRAHLSGR